MNSRWTASSYSTFPLASSNLYQNVLKLFLMSIFSTKTVDFSQATNTETYWQGRDNFLS